MCVCTEGDVSSVDYSLDFSIFFSLSLIFFSLLALTSSPRLHSLFYDKDILLALHHSFVATRGSLRIIMHFAVALAYLLSHSLVLLYQLVTLSVALNSHGSVLLTVVISNQFMELKVSKRESSSSKRRR